MDTVDDLKKDIIKKNAIVKNEQQRLKPKIEQYNAQNTNNDYFKQAEILLNKREIEKKNIEQKIIKENIDVNDKSLTTLTNNYFYQKAINDSQNFEENEYTEKTNEIIRKLEEKKIPENKNFWKKISENLKKIILGY